MIHFNLLKKGINTSALLSQINRNEKLWDEIKLRQDTNGSPHKYTETIFIRWCKDLDLHSAFHDLEAIDYPARNELSQINHLISEVMNVTNSKTLGRVLITKLKPGANILPHSDEGIVCASYERFHIPLYSKNGNSFCAGVPNGKFEDVHMSEGELWFFNNKAIHWLRNDSLEPRIHLIVDAIAPQFRRDVH